METSTLDWKRVDEYEIATLCCNDSQYCSPAPLKHVFGYEALNASLAENEALTAG